MARHRLGCSFAEVDRQHAGVAWGWPDPLPGRGDRLTAQKACRGVPGDVPNRMRELLASVAAEPSAAARDSSPA
jgi:hypothetical protein